MKKILSMLLALVMVFGLVACANNAPTSTPTTTAPVETPEATQGTTVAPTDPKPAGVSFTVVVTDLDGTETTFQYTSDAETVGAALLAEGLIAGDQSDYGLYVTTVNGITADWATENAYWAFYIDGEYAQTGVDATPITEGAVYSLTKTVSYTVKGEGATTFYFDAVNEDGTVTKFEIHTDKTTVGEALVELGVIAGDPSDYGLYVTTVNGVTADWATENAYWAFYIGDDYSQTGVDSTSITAGASYKMVKTVSYTVKGEGATVFYFTVRNVDKTVTRFEIHTDKTTVGEALLELGLIEGTPSDYGLYVTTVNGITADWDTEQAYWAFYIGSEYAQTGVDATEIVAGTTYTFEKTVSA